MIQDDDYRMIAELVEKFTGISLGPDGHYLVDARLTNLARELNFTSRDELLDKVRANSLNGPSNDALVCAVLDAMTTNESLFFRDVRPFQILINRILPPLLERNKANKRIRIWSAACSTGQEPYSIAMTILDAGDMFSGWNIEILATDVCQKVLSKAKSGQFTSLEVQRGLPPELLSKYFTENKGTYQIKESVRNRVKFERLNLIEPFQQVGSFDIIFCRNVLIYFKVDLKKKILIGLANQLCPGGVLFLGGAESATGSASGLESVHADGGVLYQKVINERGVA